MPQDTTHQSPTVISRRRALVGAGAAALALATPAPAAEALGRLLRPRTDHIMFIAWDGFDPAYYGTAPTPNLDRLASLGFRSTTQGVMTSITNPSWSSVATGAWPERTLNTAYFYDEATGLGRGQMRDIAVPTIAQAVRASGGTVASSQWFILQNYGTSYGDPEGIYMQNGDAVRRFDDMIAVLEGRPVKSGAGYVTAPHIPQLMAVYCDDLDSAGHDGGDINPASPSVLAMLDAQLGRLIEAVKRAGIFERTTFILQGDHGMTTFTQRNGQAVLDAIASTGHRGQFVGSGQRPNPDTDVVMVVGGVASTHLLGSAADDEDVIHRALAAVPHIAAVYDKTWQRQHHMSPRYGQLILEPEPGWSIALGEQTGPSGRHGATTEQEAFFLMGGCGVARNRRPRHIRHVDVAPTMAALLGIPCPSGAQGRVLREALASPRRES